MTGSSLNRTLLRLAIVIFSVGLSLLSWPTLSQLPFQTPESAPAEKPQHLPDFVEVPTRYHPFHSSYAELPGCSLSPSINPLSSCVALSSIHIPKEFTAASIEPGELELRIRSRTADGSRKNSCDDVYEVRLDGPALHVPRLTCDGSTGELVTNTWLVEEGTYNVTVRFVETMRHLKPRVCFSRTESFGYLLGGSSGPGLRVTVRTNKHPPMEPLAVHRHHDKQGPTQPERPEQREQSSEQTEETNEPRSKQRRKMNEERTCAPAAFYDGRLVRTPDEVRVPYVTSRKYGYEWRTRERCDWPALWSLERLKDMVAGRWILFMGDSTMQETATTMVELLTQRKFEKRWNLCKVITPPKFKRTDARTFDARLDRGTRITQLWNANPNPLVVSGYGISAMATNEFQARLQSLVQLGSPNGSRPDAVVLNSGLHDLYAMQNEKSFDKYEADVRVALQMVANLTDLPIWRQTNPQRQKAECNLHRPWPTGRASVERLNGIARRLAQENHFYISDISPLLLALPLEGDHHHCRRTLPCDLYTLSFFNFFHHHWQRARPSRRL